MAEKIINLFGIRQKIILCRTEIVKGKTIKVYMEPITEEQEIRIDNSIKYYGELRYERFDKTIITSKDIYLYGEINFKDDNDINQINRLNLIDDKGAYIYSTFNYDKGNYSTIDYQIKCSPTWNPIYWFMYCHCLIGKPKRIIVYREPIIKRR